MVDNEQINRRKKPVADVYTATEFYCPHAYLILSYHEVLNESEKVNTNTRRSKREIRKLFID